MFALWHTSVLLSPWMFQILHDLLRCFETHDPITVSEQEREDSDHDNQESAVYPLQMDKF